MDAPFQQWHPGAKVVVASLPLNQKGASAMKITTIGIDLAKAVFQIHGVDEHGKAILRKRLNRSGSRKSGVRSNIQTFQALIWLAQKSAKVRGQV
jgi:hypothetical protein